MRTRMFTLLPLAALLTVACGGGDATGPSNGAPPAPTYANIAGTYNGVLVGTAGGINLNAVFSITVAQTAGSLSGSYGMTGALSDGVASLPILGSGSLTGSIAAGGNP